MTRSLFFIKITVLLIICLFIKQIYTLQVQTKNINNRRVKFFHGPVLQTRHFPIISATSQITESSNSIEIDENDNESEKDGPPALLRSSVGVDYVPLATMLATRDFLGADQFTRDNLIKISGATAAGRNFVYFTEVKRMPLQDLITMEKLWLHYSDGKFGYSVQQRAWQLDNGNFDNFIRRIGWTKVENGNERKLKWFGANEFIYDLDKAPKGHLPLTSALRGTQLIKQIMELPVWRDYDWKNYRNVPWTI